MQCADTAGWVALSATSWACIAQTSGGKRGCPEGELPQLILPLPDRVRASFKTSKAQGMPCKSKSNISMGLRSSPFPSIFNFSQICGSGTNGASPSVRAIARNSNKGCRSIQFKGSPHLFSGAAEFTGGAPSLVGEFSRFAISASVWWRARSRGESTSSSVSSSCHPHCN